MKEIRIFLASAFELEPDRARIGDLIRRLNDQYEKQFIHLRLVKWEDLDSFYNSTGKQGEYDYQIRRCDFFVALFWHRAGRFTVHEVEVARESINPQNILIFKKDAPFSEDCEGSEDIKRFRERFTNDPEALSISEQQMEQFMEAQKPFLTYTEFSELEAVLTRKLEEYCSTVEVSEEEKKQTFSGDAILIHVAASPEIEPDLARLGDLIRSLDENSKHYCRIRMIPELPECDMFVSMCHTSAPKPFQDEIASAIKVRQQSGQDKPHLYFCIKYLEAGTQREQSMDELERRFSDTLAHFPDRYAQPPEMKLHFILQLERLKHSSSSNAMLIVKNGILYQKNGDSENPLMSCDDMVSLQKDEDYQDLKHRRDELEAEMAELKEKDRNSDQDLSQEIHGIYEELCDIEEQIENRQQGCLRLARLIEEMIGKEQDESILRIRKLLQDGQIERALKRLPKPKDLCQDIDEMLKRHQAEYQRYYDVCKLTISCLLASNAKKNRNSICELYEKLIGLADAMKDNEKEADACIEYVKFLHYFGMYDKALEYLQMTLDIQLNSWGENHLDVATSYNNIGRVWAGKGNYDKALEYHEKALSIQLRLLGEDNLQFASTYNGIGSIWAKKGNYDKALEYHEKALSIQLRLLGEDNLQVATSYNSIASVWEDKHAFSGEREFDKELEYYEKALSILLRLLGEDHPDVATCYNNIATVWSGGFDFDKALEYHEKALSIQLRLFGEDHPDVATSYNNIGTVLRIKGDFDKALGYFEKALSIRLHVFGEVHPDVAHNYNSIGCYWFGKFEFDKAREYFDKVSAIKQRLNGENNPQNPTTILATSGKEEETT